MLDHSEFSLFDIDREIAREFSRLSRSHILSNVRDRDHIDQWFHEERPEVVFHAAALKHVPLVESHPDQGFLTNVVGTLNVTEAAKKCGATDMVMISTDKAVAPSNVMGATKRLAESIVRHARQSSTTRFTVVRFGNVLGSAGSVVPIFKDQIARGGPVTVTHRDVERYFMTIPEAVQLVIHAAATRAAEPSGSGDLGIHVLDMGQPVRVHDLAERMIALSGKIPGRDIRIDIIGLRPGEKLTEELIDETEQVVRQHQGVMEVADRRPGGGLTRQDIQALQQVAEAGDRDRVRRSVYDLIEKVRLRNDA
jgi:O-antigen biosynthesis protein WbqV